MSSQSPFQLKTVRSIFSFVNSQPSQEKSQGQAEVPGLTLSSGRERKKKKSLNLALSQVNLGSPVEGLAHAEKENQCLVQDKHHTKQGRSRDTNDVFGFGFGDAHFTQQTLNVTQSQDVFSTPDFITPSDAQVKLPAPGFNSTVGSSGGHHGAFGLSLSGNPPTRDETPLGHKRPRSVFDVLMCPENRRSQVQAYTQELNAYKPPGTRVRSSGVRKLKAMLASPTCVKNPFRASLANIPGNVHQENLLCNTDDEGQQGTTSATTTTTATETARTTSKMETEDAFDEPQLGLAVDKRKKSVKKRKKKPKMHMAISGMNSGRYRGDFKEVQRLGHGSFSTVYRCIHRLDGTQYAVKHVKRNLNMSNTEIAQALQEVQAYSAVGPHPNVLNYHTSWIENSRLYIQLELSDCCLTDLSKQGKTFAEDELTWMLWSILQALHHMHSHTLAHMDVKPDNIHIVDNKYKIGDLGTCTQYVDGSKKREIGIGTRKGQMEVEGGGGGVANANCLYREGDARYMAPELLNDNLEHLDKSDVWALGATAYELARRCPLPMKGEDYREIREDSLSPLPNFSDRIFDLIKTMMKSNPLERPSAAQLMQCTIFDNVRNNTQG
jgi:wee1-like protein kinase